MNTTGHALNRVHDRLLQAGIDPELAEQIQRTAETFASKCSNRETVAIRLRSLSYMVGHAWSDQSNGDTIVAVVRSSMVTTYMFRRSSQPFTPQALNVERTVTL